ncbi:MAG: flagellar filament capping protein FliD [Clostridiales bacterium]|nr:flagellar filament capping protein FliD [Clostridiales bacterium]
MGRNNGSSGPGNLNFLSDYASIKSGSYLKLMKAYYNTVDSNQDSSGKKNSVSFHKETTSTSQDSAKTLAAIESDAEALKESADALLVSGSKSLFREKDITTTAEDGTSTTQKGYDTDAIYKGVKAFVDDYNALLKTAGDVNSKTILQQTLNMTNYTNANSRLLSKVGITVNSDHTLSVDEKTFKAADMSTVKSLFNGHGSYAYKTSASASMIDYTAGREAEKANTYTSLGTYSPNHSSGNIFADYF